MEHLHGTGECAYPRQNNGIRPADGIRIIRQYMLLSQIPQGIFYAENIACAVVNYRNHYNAPFVESSAPVSFSFTAACSAWATALKAASHLWWSLLPYSMFTCRVMPA